MSTNDHTVCWNASSFDMAMWIMAVEDKFTPWMQRCDDDDGLLGSSLKALILAKT